jgi:hypothetical protein
LQIDLYGILVKAGISDDRPMSKTSVRANRIIIALFVGTFYFVFRVLQWQNSPLINSIQIYLWEWDVLNGIVCFKIHGFVASYFLPCGYSNIPAFAEILFSTLHVLGIKTVFGLREAAICINLGGLIVLFYTMTLMKDRLFALGVR